MGSVGAVARGSVDRYFQQEITYTLKLVLESIEGQIDYKGPLSIVLHRLSGGQKAGVGYVEAQSIDKPQKRIYFTRVYTSE
ncbi:MAG: Inosine-5'-monophosphate dehydrogenase [Hyphomicrobiaceae bacterium hypho_1]